MEPPPGGGTVAEPESLPEEAPRCLSGTSAPYLPQLQELTFQAADQWRFYQQLARRTAGPFARTLSGLAADQRRHAKRLSAAAFLISGVRLFPAEGRGAALPAPLPAALRAAFAWEQQTESVLRAAAVETADEALQSLYLELAEEDAAHADAVRGLLEQL
jgi:hypothetical protein